MEARGGKRETEAELRKQTAPPDLPLPALLCWTLSSRLG